MLFVFWDNSNIHYSGIKVCEMIQAGKDTRLYRTHFKNLFELVRDDRDVKSAFVAGSVPPPSDAVWRHLDQLGVHLILLDKTASGKEQDSVDMSLQTWMFRMMCDHEPGTMALITGDGSGKSLGKGFLADLERIHDKGWDVEVYAWETTCNRYLKDFAERSGRFVSLEKHYYSISFLESQRFEKELS